MEEIDFKWPNGFFADGIHAGLRKKRLDMGWVVSEVPAQSAGVYTTNQFQAAPTKLTKETINKKHELQAIIMNSAVANSCTGIEGTENAHEEQALVASKLGIDKDLVGVASTGVIGVQLPMDKIKQGLAELQKTKNFKVTEAVLTTDTHSKTISVSFEVFGKTCTISGFCKGSGMIKPNMATMLGFVVTDAKVAGQKLQETLVELTNETFNQITVDGDTSTNDMVVVMANGQAMQDEPELSEGSEYEIFKAALKHVLGFWPKKSRVTVKVPRNLSKQTSTGLIPKKMRNMWPRPSLVQISLRRRCSEKMPIGVESSMRSVRRTPSSKSIPSTLRLTRRKSSSTRWDLILMKRH